MNFDLQLSNEKVTLNHLQGGPLPIISPINGLINGFAWGYNPTYRGELTPFITSRGPTLWRRFLTLTILGFVFVGVIFYGFKHPIGSGQISIIPKPELRGFWGSSLIKPPFRVTSADVVIICPDRMYITIKTWFIYWFRLGQPIEMHRLCFLSCIDSRMQIVPLSPQHS